ncbi:potassium channel family protein [Microbacterium oleivorans]|uniref:potassium channel family protein n=1 Tax=Microbacterium TaxID=33882 RepID=UPI0033C9F96D
MEWLVRAAGAVIVLLVLRDMFHTLGHPEGQGSLSRLVLRTIWRMSQYRQGRGRLGQLSGPLGLSTVIVTWGTLAVVGWALLYLPSVPEGFIYGPGSATDSANAPLDALYISMITISTLGFGDVVPAPGWLRMAVPLEALFGFGLLTVAVSWVLQIYPALARRRVLAITLSTMRRAEVVGGNQDADSVILPVLLEQLATAIIQARVDLSEYSETYYFRDTDPNSSLAAMLPYAADLAGVAKESSQPDMRIAARLLTGALEEFAGVLQGRFPRTTPTMSDLLAAYAIDHGHDPVKYNSSP